MKFQIDLYADIVVANVIEEELRKQKVKISAFDISNLTNLLLNHFKENDCYDLDYIINFLKYDSFFIVNNKPKEPIVSYDNFKLYAK